MNVTPRSSARWIVAIDSSQSAWPYHSLMPMQPRPCAETVSSPSETLCTLVLPISVWPRHRLVWPLRVSVWPRHAAAVDPDLGIEQLQALLLFEQRGRDAFAVGLQQFQPLLLARSRAHQPGIAEHVAHGHARRAEPAQQQQPVEVTIAEAPAPVRGAFDAAQQADPLIPAKRVLRQPALLRRSPARPALHHVINTT